MTADAASAKQVETELYVCRPIEIIFMSERKEECGFYFCETGRDWILCSAKQAEIECTYVETGENPENME